MLLCTLMHSTRMKPCFWILLFATFAVNSRPQGFDLSDAFDDKPAPTKQPEKPKSGGGGFDLNDAVHPDPVTQKPNVVHNNDGGTGGGSFKDSDLNIFDGDKGYKPDSTGGGGARAADPAYGGGGAADEPQAAGSGQIAGIVSAVGVALIGAASSYFAYQKKKLCFNVQGGDPESGHRDQSGTRSDPQVLSNLLRIS
ncbi:CD99 antigen-like protein 2 isoform X1 [Arapaima gigas]